MTMADSIIKDLEEKIAHRRLVKELRAEIAILNEKAAEYRLENGQLRHRLILNERLREATK